MKSSLKLITFKDISISLHWTFVLLLIWLIIVNLIAGFSLSGLVWSLLFIMAVLGSILLHELAHSFVASKFSIYAKRIILLPIGGIASIEKLPDTPLQEMMISAVGPISNLLIAMILSVFIQSDTTIGNFIGFNTAITASNSLYSLFIVNIVLAAVNIVPAYPFDGGRILRALLGFRYNYIRASTIANTTGKIIAGMLIVAGAILLNLLLALTGLFILLFSGAEKNYLRLKALFKDLKLNETLMYDYNSLQANMTVNEAANILDSNHSKRFIVMKNSEPVGIINRLEIVKSVAEMKYDRKIQELMKEEVKIYNGDTEVEDILDELAANDERIFLVKNGHFNGVTNFQHIVEHLLIHKAHTEDYRKIRSLVGLLN
jgi:Zn-dependent protease/CBS domain-containing protein